MKATQWQSKHLVLESIQNVTSPKLMETRSYLVGIFKHPLNLNKVLIVSYVLFHVSPYDIQGYTITLFIVSRGSLVLKHPVYSFIFFKYPLSGKYV